METTSPLAFSSRRWLPNSMIPTEIPSGSLGATEVTAPEKLSAAGESPTCASSRIGHQQHESRRPQGDGHAAPQPRGPRECHE